MNSALLVWPAAGATNVTPSGAKIYIAASAAFPNGTYNLSLKWLGGPNPNLQLWTLAFKQVRPSTLPAGSKTPPFPNPTYYASALGSYFEFGGHSTIQTYWSRWFSNCTPDNSMGSFSTS